MIRVALLLLLLAHFTGACRPFPDEEPLPAVSHPNSDGLWDLESPSSTVVLPVNSNGVAVDQAAASHVTVARIGSRSGSRRQILGSVEDGIIDERMGILLLDGRYNEIRRYSPHGELIELFGRAGRGPAEFMAPRRMAILGETTLAVADRGSDIKLFGYQDDRFVFSGTLSLSLVPEDVCALGDTLIVQGVDDSGLRLHAVDPLGMQLFAFDPGYQSDNQLVRDQLSDGPLACLPEARMVVTGFELFPLIRGYSHLGRHEWTARVDGFQMTRITELIEDGTPAVSFERDDRGVDILHGIVPFDESSVVIQIVRSRLSADRQRVEIGNVVSFLLDARSGDGHYLGAHIPPLLAVHDERYIAAETDPYVHVRIVEMTR